MEEDVFTHFEQNGRITLVLEKNHANFETATHVADEIRRRHSRDGEGLAQAVNAANIVVEIPVAYRQDPVAFISELMQIDIYDPDPEARVVINEKTGSIVISGDVEIGDVIVSHNNIVVEAGQTAEFDQISTEDIDQARLDSLVDALTSLKVPHADVIEIIKGIERNGKLHARLVIQ